MGSQQLYSLSWGEFGSSLTSTVQILRNHNEMVDVTLAAGGRIFPAHKLVLSAASPLLMQLLKSTHCHHPVLMLAGITAPDLEALLQFVYQGEVSVDSTQLPSLLQAAHCLDIQALSPQTLTTEKTMAQVSAPPVMTDNVREMNVQTISSSRDLNMTPQPQTSRDLAPLMPVRKRKRKQSQSSETESMKWGISDGAVVTTVEAQQLEQVSDSHSEDTKEGIMDEQHSNSETELATSTEGKLRCASEQPCICSQCGLVIRQARNLRRHLLTSCPSRPIPEVEYQIEIPETYVPSADLLPNHSQENSLHGQSTLSSQLDLNIPTCISEPTSDVSQTTTSDLT